MHPEICKIGPVTIYSYGLMLVVAFFVVLILLNQKARKEGVDINFIFNLLFVVFIGGIIGARLFYVIENIEHYFKNPQEIIMLQHGGLSWFGGLILGGMSGVVYIKKKRGKIYKTLDLVIPFVALGQAIGRIGCFLNGCCYGKLSKFGIYFPVLGESRIPTQIYSSLFLVIIFVILRFIQERKHRDGQIFYTYLILYSAGRFFIEFWRADNPVILLGLTLFQIISVVVLLFSILGLITILRIRR